MNRLLLLLAAAIVVSGGSAAAASSPLLIRGDASHGRVSALVAGTTACE